jgi:polysaccharide biosynthesis protein PslH
MSNPGYVFSNFQDRQHYVAGYSRAMFGVSASVCRQRENMTFIQVTLGEPEGIVSGVGLRNQSIFQNILKFTQGHSVRVFSAPALSTTPNRRHPTVSTLNKDSLEQLLKTIKLIKPDFIIFEGVPLLEAVIAVRAAYPNLNLIADFHNVESNLLNQIQNANLPDFMQFPASLIFAGSRRKAKDADQKFVSLVNQIWTCSPEDAVLVRNLTASKPVHIVPNPIPVWCSSPGPVESRSGKQILFVGHLGYRPNKQAVRELCNYIFPRIRKAIPDTTLHIAGRNPGRRISNAVQAAGGLLTKNPKELGNIYRQAAVAAIPLRSGGGTRIKILEALAVGLPIVATRKAVEGLDLQNDIHFHAAETTSEFAAAIEKILTDPRSALELAENGQKMAFAKYGSDAVFASVSSAVAALI